MLLLSREDIQKVFTMKDAIAADKEAFQLVAEGKCETPLRTNIFDSQSAVLSESGDILIPLEEGIISEKDFTGNLGDVIKGRLVGRENDNEIIVYETVGVAAQDLITAKRIYDKAVAAGVGTEWN